MAVSHLPLTAESQVRFRSNTCGICGKPTVKIYSDTNKKNLDENINMIRWTGHLRVLHSLYMALKGLTVTVYGN